MENERFNNIYENLKKYNQEHLLAFYNTLNDNEKEHLLNTLGNIDLDKVKKLYEERDIVDNKDLIEPIPYVDKSKLHTAEYKEYIKIGEEIIKSGKYAFVTMAGGQGTRLGHNGPKGTYKLGINPDKSLFEIMSDSLKRAKKEFGVYIPWYIMTSRENNEDTVKFFKANNYFGYPKEDIMFFKQRELPMLDKSGKILLENKYTVREAADGHGGVFEAMNREYVLEDMKKRNIEWVFIGGIDNVLLNMVDLLLLGMAEKNNVLIAGKSIVKRDPTEKVGVFCKRNGRPSVVEYTEITEDMANMVDSDGELIYGESHILCNLFNTKALEIIKNEELPYHTAFKKSKYIDSTGNEIEPLSPNAYKFETFIFDAFSKVEDMLILRCARAEEFAPVKNKEGEDSPETARKLYKDYYMK